MKHFTGLCLCGKLKCKYKEMYLYYHKKLKKYPSSSHRTVSSVKYILFGISH